MHVTVNGHDHEVADALTLGDLVHQLDLPRRGAAIALDRCVVPRSRWESVDVHDGAEVEVVVPLQGG